MASNNEQQGKIINSILFYIEPEKFDRAVYLDNMTPCYQNFILRNTFKWDYTDPNTR